jgi:hypothetical protein
MGYYIHYRGGDMEKEDYILKLSVYQVFTKIQYISHLNEYKDNYQTQVNRELQRSKMRY